MDPVETKRIAVSLSQQRLWAYDGNNLVLTTLVTTGNKVLPTPTGLFYILASQVVLHSIRPATW